MERVEKKRKRPGRCEYCNWQLGHTPPKESGFYVLIMQKGIMSLAKNDNGQLILPNAVKDDGPVVFYMRLKDLREDMLNTSSELFKDLKNSDLLPEDIKEEIKKKYDPFKYKRKK